MLNTKYVLRTVVLALAGSVLVFLLVGLVLADSWQVKTTRTIRATAERVAGMVTHLSEWSEWSALDFRLGNPTTREVEGAQGTVDQLATWRGPMGVATVRLTRVDDAGVDYAISYKYGPEGRSFGGEFTGSIEWLQTDESTKVTWIENGKLDNLVQRWSNWFGALQVKVQQVQRSSLAGMEENIRRADDKAGDKAGDKAAASNGDTPPK